MKADGKVYPIAEQRTNVLEQDMAYWSVKRKIQNKGMFDPEKLWMKILPFVPFIMAGVIIIFILYILMTYLPDILAQLRDLTAELNRRNTADITTSVVLPLIS